MDDLRLSWIFGVTGFFGWNPRGDQFLDFEPRYSAWTDELERFKTINPDEARFEIGADG